MAAENGEVIDSTAVEVTSQSMEVVPAQPSVLAVTPTVKASELVDRLNVIKEAAETAMVKDVDYGNVPGTNKPTLFKPGAEKLSVLFQLDVQLVNEKVWGPGAHLTVISHATVFHAPSGSRLGYGEGVCTTRERKYAYRRADRVCPTCNAPTVFKSKQDPGWFCWAKKGGCGAKFPDDNDPKIVGQTVGDVENPDLPDLWNTVVKMAEKRARVDAVLSVTGASALFTQDIEDTPQSAPAWAEEPQQAAAAPAPPKLPKLKVDEILAAFQVAKMPTDWLRMQLVAIGAQNVPEGDIVVGTIQSLTAGQAELLLKVCADVVEGRAKAEARKQAEGGAS